MFKLYLNTILLLIGVLLSLVALTNYYIDPAGIYQDQRVSPNTYAKRLIESKSGLAWPEGMFEGRALALALAAHSSEHDCIVIGSSHVMQISSFRKSKSLEDVCLKILNLGVSGASLEDHMTLAYLALKSGAQNKKIIFGLDPWTLTHNMDNRWLAYQKDYLSARRIIFGKINPASTEKSPNKLANLLNGEYTIRSLNTLRRLLKKGPLRIEEVESQEEVGLEDATKLPDGSHIYSAKYIDDANRSIIPLGGKPYKTDVETSTERGVEEYKQFLSWVLSSNHEPILLMTPYHHNVWKQADSPNVVAMQKTEAIVLKIADELELRVFGSYDPEMFGCKEDEFYDFMHPKAACLSRLKQRKP
jgi:hypothetical protein